MELTFTFFSDLIDALGKVAGGLKSIANLPKAQREKIRQTLGENYLLIGTTLNMVIIRLGDILLQPNNQDFLREAARLDNYTEWMQAEREFRLCQSLRVASRETETLAGKLAFAASTKDWDALLKQMRAILTTESEVAVFIGQQFQKYASDARSAGNDGKRVQSIRDALAAFRNALKAEREKLIEQEQALYSIV